MAAEPRYIVIDVETQRGFNEVDRKKLHLLKISVACAYDSQTDQYLSFEEREMMKLEELLFRADLVVGFNVKEFDLEVLRPYFVKPVETLPVLDILIEFEKIRGHRIGLQSVAQATLGQSKSGSGWDALKLFKEGRFDELKRYCIDDVRLTKEIYEYGVRNGHIKFISNRDYQTYEVPMQWTDAAKVLKDLKKEASSFPTSLF